MSNKINIEPIAEKYVKNLDKATKDKLVKYFLLESTMAFSTFEDLFHEKGEKISEEEFLRINGKAFIQCQQKCKKEVEEFQAFMHIYISAMTETEE